jgi:HAMP domain-containing protein
MTRSINAGDVRAEIPPEQMLAETLASRARFQGLVQ